MSSSDLKLLGETIKQEREAMNLTLRDFAKLTGVSFSQLSKIERGEHRPTRETLDKIDLHVKTQKAWLYLMAGYSSLFQGTLQQVQKELTKDPVAYIAEEDKEIVTHFLAQQTVSESASDYSTKDWNHFIEKMESKNIGPKEIEEMIEDYQKVRTILLKK